MTEQPPTEQPQQVQVTVYRVAKTSRRTGRTEPLSDWTEDAVAAKERMVQAQGELSHHWKVSLEQRQQPHPAYFELRSAEHGVKSATARLLELADHAAHLMERCAKDVRRRAADLGREDRGDLLAEEVGRASVTVISNVRIDQMHAAVREVERYRTMGQRAKAEIERLEAAR